MFKEYKVKLTNKNKPSYSAKIIRSPGFASKNYCENDSPVQINGKNVFLYHTPQLHSNKNIPQQDQGIALWALSDPGKYTPKTISKSASERKRRSFSLSQNILRKYMKRRPSLTLVTQSYNFNEIFVPNLDETIQNSPNAPVVKNEIYNISSDRTKRSQSGRCNKTNTTVSSYMNMEDEKNQIQAGPDIFGESQKQHYNQFRLRTQNILKRKKKLSQH